MTGMKTIAVYNLKGGVGKTTTAVNLAWCAARRSARKTLLWDLDPQAAASFLIGDDGVPKDEAQSIFAKQVDPAKLAHPSTVSGINIISADASLRGLDRLLFDIGKRKRLKKLIDTLAAKYDRIILDCPPGLNETADQVLRAADLVIVPVIPSPLSDRAFAAVRTYLDRQSGKHAPMLPVYSMVDRRRTLHREALRAHPDWPVIPMTSMVEKMGEERRPLGEFDQRTPAFNAYVRLWEGIEKKLSKGA